MRDYSNGSYSTFISNEKENSEKEDQLAQGDTEISIQDGTEMDTSDVTQQGKSGTNLA